MGDAYDDGYPHMDRVFHVVYANNDSDDPSQSEMLTWIESYDLYNSTLMPGTSDGAALLEAFDRRECTYVVETGCMTILRKECYGITDALAGLAEAVGN